MSYQVWALLNTLVCGAIVFICICRLSVMHMGIRKLVRLKYTMLLSGAMGYGFQPFLFDTWPTPAGMWFPYGHGEPRSEEHTSELQSRT